MLLIKPEEEQSLRNRISLMRELLTEDTELPERGQRLAELEKFEEQLDGLKRTDEFRRISQDYWSSNEAQVSAIAKILGEASGEMEWFSGQIEEANRLKKPSNAAGFERRRAELSAICKDLLELVPAGAKTGELVRAISESWEKLKGAKIMMDALEGFLSQVEEKSISLSKKLAPEKKRLANLRKEQGKIPSKEFESQKAKVLEFDKQDAALESEAKRIRKSVFEMQSAIPDLTANLKLNASELASLSGKNSLAEGSSKPFKEILTSYSIPFTRALAEEAAAKLPRDVIQKRQAAAAREYEDLRAKFETAVQRAKSRARCKRCREMSDALLSAAVDRDSQEVKECLAFLQDGDIFQAKKTLERVFSSGNMHEYARAELEAMMDELLQLYDQKGELSGLEQKLRDAGSEALGARLDLMRLDYILGGVHSPKEFLSAAKESIKWLEGLGMLFRREIHEEIEKSGGNPEIFRLSTTRGFSKEQEDIAKDMLELLKSEADSLRRLGSSETAEQIAEKEASLASSISASENFGNPLYLTSLLSGDKNALSMMERMLDNAGDSSQAIGAYADTIIKQEALRLLGSDVDGISAQVSQLKDLCTEIGKLKSPVKKDSEKLSQKLALTRKTKDLGDALGKFVGGEIEDSIRLKLSDPKLSGEKLYNEIISSKQVSDIIRRKLSGHAKALAGIGGKEHPEILNSSAS